nr:hypothetical protein [Chitinophagaceae bacterium]
MLRYLLAASLLFFMACQTSEKTTPTPFDAPPAWAGDAIWYQIFVERFHNGDTANDPTAADIAIP